MKNIELNIFTNCTRSAPDVSHIMRTYESFCFTFDNCRQIPVTIYLDKNPNLLAFPEYKENLSRYFENIIVTCSLSEGYVHSINNSEADYLFQLEHDWTFNNNIPHSLCEIINNIDELGIYHFRFNKRQNIIAVWDKEMTESSFGDFKYCISNNLSNNPHIINRKKYIDELCNHIKIKPGSKGIEEELNNQGIYKSMLYGPAGYPATVSHTDGRG